MSSSQKRRLNSQQKMERENYDSSSKKSSGRRRSNQTGNFMRTPLLDKSNVSSNVSESFFTPTGTFDFNKSELGSLRKFPSSAKSPNKDLIDLNPHSIEKALDSLKSGTLNEENISNSFINQHLISEEPIHKSKEMQNKADQQTNKYRQTLANGTIALEILLQNDTSCSRISENSYGVNHNKFEFKKPSARRQTADAAAIISLISGDYDGSFSKSPSMLDDCSYEDESILSLPNDNDNDAADVSQEEDVNYENILSSPSTHVAPSSSSGYHSVRRQTVDPSDMAALMSDLNDSPSSSSSMAENFVDGTNGKRFPESRSGALNPAKTTTTIVEKTTDTIPSTSTLTSTFNTSNECASSKSSKERRRQTVDPSDMAALMSDLNDSQSMDNISSYAMNSSSGHGNEKEDESSVIHHHQSQSSNDSSNSNAQFAATVGDVSVSTYSPSPSPSYSGLSAETCDLIDGDKENTEAGTTALEYKRRNTSSSSSSSLSPIAAHHSLRRQTVDPSDMMALMSDLNESSSSTPPTSTSNQSSFQQQQISFPSNYSPSSRNKSSELSSSSHSHGKSPRKRSSLSRRRSTLDPEDLPSIYETTSTETSVDQSFPSVSEGQTSQQFKTARGPVDLFSPSQPRRKSKSRRDTFEGGIAGLNNLLGTDDNVSADINISTNISVSSVSMSTMNSPRRSPRLSKSRTPESNHRRATADPIDLAALVQSLKDEDNEPVDYKQTAPKPKPTSTTECDISNLSSSSASLVQVNMMPDKKCSDFSDIVGDDRSTLSELSSGRPSSFGDDSDCIDHDRRKTADASQLAVFMHDLEEQELELQTQLQLQQQQQQQSSSFSMCSVDLNDSTCSDNASIDTMGLLQGVDAILRQESQSHGEGDDDSDMNRTTDTIATTMSLQHLLNGSQLGNDDSSLSPGQQTQCQSVSKSTRSPRRRSSLGSGGGGTPVDSLQHATGGGTSNSNSSNSNKKMIVHTERVETPPPTSTTHETANGSQPVLKSCLSSRKLRRGAGAGGSDTPQGVSLSGKKSVVFGSPEAAEFNKNSPTTNFTPMSRSKTKDHFSMAPVSHQGLGADENDDDTPETAENSQILAEWDRLTSDDGGCHSDEDIFPLPDFASNSESDSHRISLPRSSGKQRRSKRRRSMRHQLPSADDDQKENAQQVAAGTTSGSGSGKRRRRRRSREVSSQDDSEILQSDSFSVNDENSFSFDASGSFEVSGTVQLPGSLEAFLQENERESSSSSSSHHHHPSQMSTATATSVSHNHNPQFLASKQQLMNTSVQSEHTQELEMDLHGLLHRVDMDCYNTSFRASHNDVKESPCGSDKSCNSSGAGGLALHLSGFHRISVGPFPMSPDQSDQSLGGILGRSPAAKKEEEDEEVLADDSHCMEDVSESELNGPQYQPMMSSSSPNLNGSSFSDSYYGQTIQLEGRLADVLLEHPHGKEMLNTVPTAISFSRTDLSSRSMDRSLNVSATQELEVDLKMLMATQTACISSVSQLQTQTQTPFSSSESFDMAGPSRQWQSLSPVVIQASPADKDDARAGHEDDSLSFLSPSGSSTSGLHMSTIPEESETSDHRSSSRDSLESNTAAVTTGDIEDESTALHTVVPEHGEEQVPSSLLITENGAKCNSSDNASTTADNVEVDCEIIPQEGNALPVTPAVLRKVRRLNKTAQQMEDMYSNPDNIATTAVVNKRAVYADENWTNQDSNASKRTKSCLEEKDTTNNNEKDIVNDTYNIIKDYFLDSNATVDEAIVLKEALRQCSESVRPVATQALLAAAELGPALGSDVEKRGRRLLSLASCELEQWTEKICGDRTETVRKREELEQALFSSALYCKSMKNCPQTKRLNELKAQLEKAQEERDHKQAMLTAISEQTEALLDQRKEELAPLVDNLYKQKVIEEADRREMEVLAAEETVLSETRQTLMTLNSLSWCRLESYQCSGITVEIVLTKSIRHHLHFDLRKDTDAHGGVSMVVSGARLETHMTSKYRSCDTDAESQLVRTFFSEVMCPASSHSHGQCIGPLSAQRLNAVKTPGDIPRLLVSVSGYVSALRRLLHWLKPLSPPPLTSPSTSSVSPSPMGWKWDICLAESSKSSLSHLVVPSDSSGSKDDKDNNNSQLTISSSLRLLRTDGTTVLKFPLLSILSQEYGAVLPLSISAVYSLTGNHQEVFAINRIVTDLCADSEITSARSFVETLDRKLNMK